MHHFSDFTVGFTEYIGVKQAKITHVNTVEHKYMHLDADDDVETPKLRFTSQTSDRTTNQVMKIVIKTSFMSY